MSEGVPSETWSGQCVQTGLKNRKLIKIKPPDEPNNTAYAVSVWSNELEES